VISVKRSTNKTTTTTAITLKIAGKFVGLGSMGLIVGHVDNMTLVQKLFILLTYMSLLALSVKDLRKVSKII
jgi:hypothetical protein